MGDKYAGELKWAKSSSGSSKLSPKLTSQKRKSGGFWQFQKENAIMKSQNNILAEKPSLKYEISSAQQKWWTHDDALVPYFLFETEWFIKIKIVCVRINCSDFDCKEICCFEHCIDCTHNAVMSNSVRVVLLWTKLKCKRFQITQFLSKYNAEFISLTFFLL